jgi:hypothetical protein
MCEPSIFRFLLSNSSRIRVYAQKQLHLLLLMELLELELE